MQAIWRWEEAVPHRPLPAVAATLGTHHREYVVPERARDVDASRSPCAKPSKDPPGPAEPIADLPVPPPGLAPIAAQQFPLPMSARKVGPSPRITTVLRSRWNRQNPSREGQANPAALAIPEFQPIRPKCRAKQHRSVGSCGAHSKQDITLGRMSSLGPT